MDISRDAKRRGIYPQLFTDPEGDSCFSIYEIRRIKKCRFINGYNFFFWNFRETMRHFSLRSQNREYPRIFQVTGANQNMRKLLSTDLVNTKNNYCNPMDNALNDQNYWHHFFYESVVLLRINCIISLSKWMEKSWATGVWFPRQNYWRWASGVMPWAIM